MKRKWAQADFCRKRDQDDASKTKRDPLASERTRVGRIVSRARYPGWQFIVPEDRGRVALAALRVRPGTNQLEKLGPWPLPDDPGFEEVREACLAAVVSVAGEAARERLVWRAPEAGN